MTVQLWIRSGAALAKGKHYLLGQVPLNAAHLHQTLASTKQHTTPLTLPLQSQVIVDGQIHICVASDLKFPSLQGRGWFLTDPDMSGYARNGLYHLPLDQSYGYSMGKRWFLATERATESTVVLPLALSFTQLAQRACQISTTHAISVASTLLQNRHDSFSSAKAKVNVAVGYLQTNNIMQPASVSLHWQRPDSIFEVELVPSTNVPVQSTPVPFTAAFTVPFAPPITTTGILPAILASHGTNRPSFLLGNVRVQVRIASAKTTADPHAAIGSGTQVTEEEDIWEATFSLEPYINQSLAPLQIPLYHSVTGAQMGTIVLQVQVTMDSSPPVAPETVAPSTGGLVSLVGLDTLMEDNGGLPMLDFDTRTTPVDPNMQLRQQQLSTMGYFVTHAYLQQHVSSPRSTDNKAISDRANSYHMALSYNPQEDQVVPSYEDKTPKPFRPSSSRTTFLLSAIPFNVHVQSMTVENAEDPREGALFYNVTCGAPSDHARGFSNIVSSTNGTDGANKSPVGPVSGGLRRLEAKRLELAKAVRDSQSALISAVGGYMQKARLQKLPSHHIPARDPDTSVLRWKVFEATQALHHVTWTCAVRRANVFSQALGIAVSSYLASVSDSSKVGWPDVWVRHGYLITFEGLLSAAGKELGMIEDASVGIAMLRMLSVVLVPDDGSASAPNRVAVPNSPYLKWVTLTPSGVGSNTQYRLEIGMDPQYYMQRIPEPLKNGTAVRMYPLLYQVGVDIRQWGANQQMNVKDQLSTSGRTDIVEPVEEGVAVGGLLDDEDDDVGVTDEDVLISLNYEALRKMNAYAHAIAPVTPVGNAGDLLAAPTSGNNTQVHPSLSELHLHISQSSGKMNYSILIEATSVVESLGGGGAVFCKSGKDRTAMHVTFKQAQFARRYLKQQSKGDTTEVTQDIVYNDATLMRIHGTRLPICEKNVGQALYAFNALQVKFMPDQLKPPPNTLAGFLKGGRVFQGGGIES